MALSLQPRDIERIFCYYCEKNFDSMEKLLEHQRNSHARCPVCEATYSSVYVMLRHAYKAHKENLLVVPGAIPGRTSTAVDVVGMNGIPNCSRYLCQTTPKPRRRRASSYRPPPTAASKDANNAHHLTRTRVAKPKKRTTSTPARLQPRPKPLAPGTAAPADAAFTPSTSKTSIMALLNHEEPSTTDLN